jgi:hypothetical protein
VIVALGVELRGLIPQLVSQSGCAGYGTKTMPLGASTPLTATLPTVPVVRLTVPKELSGHWGGLGQTTAGALAALQGAIEV